MIYSCPEKRSSAWTGNPDFAVIGTYIYWIQFALAMILGPVYIFVMVHFHSHLSYPQKQRTEIF